MPVNLPIILKYAIYNCNHSQWDMLSASAMLLCKSQFCKPGQIDGLYHCVIIVV